MRISRKRRPQKPIIPHFNVNEQIQSAEVRLVDRESQNLGVFPRAEALRMARDAGKDLVEINPKAVPPVAQLVEFSHFKYQREKEARKQKVNAHVSDVKGIRLSIRISDHDLETRRDQAQKFLDRGDKVKMEVILRGREHSHAHFAFDVIRKFIASIQAIMPIRVDQDVVRQVNKVTAIIAKK